MELPLFCKSEIACMPDLPAIPKKRPVTIAHAMGRCVSYYNIKLWSDERCDPSKMSLAYLARPFSATYDVSWHGLVAGKTWLSFRRCTLTFCFAIGARLIRLSKTHTTIKRNFWCVEVVIKYVFVIGGPNTLSYWRLRLGAWDLIRCGVSRVLRSSKTEDIMSNR